MTSLKVLISTDNHLGYMEKDPIRSNDSFAAFEEILALARNTNCDMVLLSGDLFHENKPSRRTLYRTIEIIRRYTLGVRPVQFRVMNDVRVQAPQSQSGSQKKTSKKKSKSAPQSTLQTVFTSSPNMGNANFTDPLTSVDLPIFSIHGNHDDPTRDGGGANSELLAALDILAVGGLVNYFGRQDDVERVEIEPVLVEKGTTRVAIYGMGSMRDERLNRMWGMKKVRFLRPKEDEGKGGNEDNSDDDDSDRGGGDDREKPAWFNIFTLHQNRDLGRGSKNCVHESMIPDWMDLVVWGHEHECNIMPGESAVGTFRISQPGSSVATSLVEGEARPKNVAVLEIMGSEFRIRPVRLENVRGFAVGQISLNDPELGLDVEDPKVEEKVTEILKTRVENLIEEAREGIKDCKAESEKTKEELILDYAVEDSDDEDMDDDERETFEETKKMQAIKHKQVISLVKPEEVLVRLKVEHNGFSTLNNQRFGSLFVGQAANTTDLLLFQKQRKLAGESSNNKGKTKAGKAEDFLIDPLDPEDDDEINVEDLIYDNLVSSEKKMELLDEASMGQALESFVSRGENNAIHNAVAERLELSQSKLMNRGKKGKQVIDKSAIKELCVQSSNEAREKARQNDDATKRREAALQRRKELKMTQAGGEDDENNGGSSDSDGDEPPKKPTKKKAATKRSRGAKVDLDSDNDIDSSNIIASTGGRRPKRTAAAAKKSYAELDGGSGDDSDSNGGGSLALSSDDDEEISEEKPKKRKTAAKRTAPSKKTSPTKKRATNSRKKKSQDVIELSDDSDDDSDGNIGDWGSSAPTQIKAPTRKRARR